jgi:hypothetical protein
MGSGSYIKMESFVLFWFEIDLTLLIPLSLTRRGGNRERGASPLSKIFPFPNKGRG